MSQKQLDVVNKIISGSLKAHGRAKEIKIEKGKKTFLVLSLKGRKTEVKLPVPTNNDNMEGFARRLHELGVI